MFAALPSPVEMSGWDRAAIALGLPEALLMENASREALHVLLHCVRRERADASAPFPADLRGIRVLLFMGSGNNGGDAACLARQLHDAGADVLVLHTRPLRACKGATARHVRLARRCGVPFAPASDWPDKDPFPAPDIIVDGLLGTGFSGVLRPMEQRLVAGINALAGESVPTSFAAGDFSRRPFSPLWGAFVLALDIPSGLDGLTGQPCPLAVRAHATVTFEAAKPGLVLPEAAPFVGELHVRPIGIPRLVREQHPASYRCIDRELATLLLVPTAQWHKGTAGTVLVIGGSAGSGGGLTGAPHLAARAALRSGAGMVRVAAPAALCTEIKAQCPDIMTQPLGAPGTTSWSPDLLADLLPALQGCDAVVIGPGIGRTASTIAFVLAFFALPTRPVTVIDADALYALATAPDRLRSLAPTDILTPHPGEAARILQGNKGEDGGEKGCAEVQGNRFAALEALVRLSPAVWVLKGAGTLVGSPCAPVSIAPYAVPTLAVGGSGDVLAGCLGTLLAQGIREQQRIGQACNAPELDSHLVACLGVLVHAHAGQLLARTFPLRGNSASDIAEALPQARAELVQHGADSGGK